MRRPHVRMGAPHNLCASLTQIMRTIKAAHHTHTHSHVMMSIRFVHKINGQTALAPPRLSERRNIQRHGRGVRPCARVIPIIRQQSARVRELALK